MNPAKDNRRRAARCLNALRRYDSDRSPYTGLIDLLADAMHWCRLKGHDFPGLLDRASEHFTAEVFDETIPGETNKPAEKGILTMTNTATKTYLVGVIERAIAYYKIEAKDARTAAENWDEGEFHDRDDEALDTEGACNIRERQPDGTWNTLPPSEWEDVPEIARFSDYEIEPRIRHWENGDPEKPDHMICDEEHEADMWRLYGTMPGRDSVCIGEYATRALAEEVYSAITGRLYGRPS